MVSEKGRHLTSYSDATHNPSVCCQIQRDKDATSRKNITDALSQPCDESNKKTQLAGEHDASTGRKSEQNRVCCNHRRG